MKKGKIGLVVDKMTLGTLCGWSKGLFLKFMRGNVTFMVSAGGVQCRYLGGLGSGQISHCVETGLPRGWWASLESWKSSCSLLSK